MKLTTEKQTVTVQRVIEVDDGPVIQPAHYRSSFRLDIIRIEYIWVDGEYRVPGAYAIHMGGHWLKKDETPGKSRATDITPDYANYRTGEYTEQYVWLQPLIDLLRPTGAPSTTVLREHEVEA